MTSTPDPLRAHEQALLAFARYMLDPERANPATTDMAEVGKLAGFVINGLPAVRAALAQPAPALDAERLLREALYNCGLAAHFGGQIMESKRRGGREKLAYIEAVAAAALEPTR